MTDHVHAWTPVRGWGARYRCEGCAAFGYKPRLVTDGAIGTPAIVPYRCGIRVSREPCGQWATGKRRTRYGSEIWACTAHRS